MNTTVIITAAGLGSTLGIAVSLLFSYFPRLKVWFASQSAEFQSGIMIGLLALAAAGTLVYQCSGVLGCIQLNWGAAGVAFVSALVANQGMFLASPQTPSVKRARLRRRVAELQRAGIVPPASASPANLGSGAVPPRRRF